MNKKFQKGVAACAVAAMVVPMVSTAVPVQAKTINTTEHVDVVNVDVGEKDRDCYFYVPDSTKVGTRSCNSPIMIVLGRDKYTGEDDVKQEAQESGIADIAAEEGSIVVFANPYGEHWNADDDGDLYVSILNMFSDSSSSDWVDGKAESKDWATGGTVTSYCGSSQRTYIFADGEGADFVAANYLKAVKKVTVWPTGAVESDVTPTAYLLSNLSTAPTTSYEGKEYPTAVINGPEGIADALAALNPVHNKSQILTSDKVDGFDKDKVTEAYNSTVGTVRRQSDQILEIPDYAALGITENVKTTDVNGYNVEYREYIPDNLDMTKEGSVPLVMIFHGGGNTAEFFAWASEWPIIGKENGFMVVSVQDHTSYTSDDMTELLSILEQKYPAIDKTRVYASGFSMGAVKCWNIGLKHSDVFAGIAPFDAGYMEEPTGTIDYSPITVSESNNIMPLFYVAGAHSFASETPQADKVNVNAVMEAYFKINKITDNYVFDTSAGNVWGYKSNNEYTVDSDEYPNFPLTVSQFTSTDGNTYVSLGISDKGHETVASEAREAWKFLSKFSRNADGTISIAGQKDNTPTVTPENKAQDQPKENTGNTVKAPKTGDVNTVAVMIIILFAGLGIVFAARKRLNNK